MATSNISTREVHSKRALVIGNQEYPEMPLRNAAKDARDVTSALKKCGFRVTCGINCGRREMYDLFDDVMNASSKQDLLLFYYSGHGVQYQGTNYLIPIDAETHLKESHHVTRDCINVEHILNSCSDNIEYVTIFVLDCCRKNILDKRSRNSSGTGLQAMVAPGGTLIQYACSPGSVADDGSEAGENGLFTKHFLEQLKGPAKPLDKLLSAVTRSVYTESKRAQLPFQTSCLMTDEHIYLNGETSVPETSKSIERKPRPAEPKPTPVEPKPKPRTFSGEFDLETSEKLLCEGRRCARCKKCRDWYFTGDKQTWDWVQNWKNWQKKDWKRYDNKNIYERWQKRKDGATCDLHLHHHLYYDHLFCVCPDNYRS